VTRRQESYEVCQFKENGKPCLQILIGTSWKFCPIHGVIAKKLRKREDSANFRKDNRLGLSRIRFRHRHHLTEPRLKPLLDHSEPVQEEYACQDDFLETTVSKIDGVTWRIIQPPYDLPSAAYIGKQELKDLRTSVENHSWDPRHASTKNRLMLAIKELERDIGQWHSTKAIIRISGRAKAIQELMFEANDLPGFIHALLAHVEIQRIKYFATGQRQFLARARNWLAGAEFVCERAINRPAWKHNEIVSYLRFYIDAVKVRLVFDEGEGEDVTPLIEAVDQRTMKFVDTNSTGQVVAMVRFLNSVSHAEHQLERKDFDCAEKHLIDTEEIFTTIQCRSIESHHRIAYIKTKLALERKDREHQKYIEQYIDVFHRYPSFEYRHSLGALKGLYENELAHVTLPNDHSMFLDTTYTHIYPFVRRVY
jgi:hypothetical protein